MWYWLCANQTERQSEYLDNRIAKACAANWICFEFACRHFGQRRHGCAMRWSYAFLRALLLLLDRCLANARQRTPALIKRRIRLANVSDGDPWQAKTKPGGRRVHGHFSLPINGRWSSRSLLSVPQFPCNMHVSTAAQPRITGHGEGPRKRMWSATRTADCGAGRDSVSRYSMATAASKNSPLIAHCWIRVPECA